MMHLLRRYLEVLTVLVVLVSIPFLWEMWRMPLSSYEILGDVTVIRESNCRKVMTWGVAGSFVWSVCLLLRIVVKNQRRIKYLKPLPLILLGYLALAVIRVVEAIRIYPWFFD